MYLNPDWIKDTKYVYKASGAAAENFCPAAHKSKFWRMLSYDLH